MWPLPGGFKHFSRVAYCVDSVESQLNPMVGALWIAPHHDVMRLARANEGRPEAHGGPALVRFRVIDCRNVVLGDAFLEDVYGRMSDRRQGLQLVGGPSMTCFKFRGPRGRCHRQHI